MAEKLEYSVKMVVIGDEMVGKTSLLVRYAEDVFNEEIMSTSDQVRDYLIRYVTLDSKKIKMFLWDTCGQERHNRGRMTTHYYRSADAVMLVYDVSNAESLNHLRIWHAEAVKLANPGIPFLLIGNKTDLKREVSTADAHKLAQELKIPLSLCLETSAKTNTNVTEAFVSMARECKQFIDRSRHDTKDHEAGAGAHAGSVATPNIRLSAQNAKPPQPKDSCPCVIS